MCTSCSTGKLILRPSHVKIQNEPLKFLERIQGDIFGPIQPTSGPFRYFMVLIDASTRWSHVCLYAHVTMLLQRSLLKSLDLEHKILNIKFNQFEWTMLLNSHPVLLMIIAWHWEFKFNIPFLMYIHRMV